MIDDEQNTNVNIHKENIFESDDLLKFFFDFCDIEDILNLSRVSTKFYKITKALDYKFEEAIDKNYFSNHYNYE